MILENYLDPKDPLAYLALPGTAALLEETQVTAQWFPMQVDVWSDPGPEPATDASRGERHRWFRANYRERELQYYVRVHNLPLTNLYRQTDSSHAAIALLWLSAQQAPNNPLSESISESVVEFLQRLTQAHWAEPTSTLDNTSSIVPLLSAIEPNFDIDSFMEYSKQQGPAALTQQMKTNAEVGVIRGPAYRFDDQLYIGREHLPLLAELISE
jgi:2-hydroxychromene-2-carboxylate isomerase